MATNIDAKKMSQNKFFLKTIKELYDNDNPDFQSERFAQLLSLHQNNFGGDAVVFSSPGRIEVAGNHTDHNNGKVLAAAISLDTLAAVTPNTTGVVRISSCGYPVFSVRLDDLEKKENEKGTSNALVKGVLSFIKQKGYQIGSFDATMVSNVAKGAGVSSSASFEVLIAEIVNSLYNGGKISAVEKAIAGQYAENVYFGKPCGLMDQSAIALGDISAIDFKNPSEPVVNNFVWPFNDVEIMLINCGGDHCNLTDNYAAIRTEMEAVAGLFGKKVLREVNEDVFYDGMAKMHATLSGRAILRAIHYFEENKRIDRAVEALKNKDEAAFWDVINSSGLSSYTLLQNCYPEGDNFQNIPLALAISKKCPAVKACRVHGGGFAGTILAFVDKKTSTNYYNTMKSVFGEKNIYRLAIREFGATYIGRGDELC